MQLAAVTAPTTVSAQPHDHTALRAACSRIAASFASLGGAYESVTGRNDFVSAERQVDAAATQATEAAALLATARDEESVGSFGSSLLTVALDSTTAVLPHLNRLGALAAAGDRDHFYAVGDAVSKQLDVAWEAARQVIVRG